MTSPDQQPPSPPEFEVMPDEDLPPERKSNTALVLWIVVGLLVVAGLLFALLGPSIPKLPIESDVLAAHIQMSNFGHAIDNYRLMNKKLPASLEVLTEGDDHSLHPYIHSIPNDPWGNPYDYQVLERTTYRIRSNGADGERDTEDDIVYPRE